MPEYFSDYCKFNRQKKEIKDIEFQMGRPYPVLGEKYREGGTAKGEYFHQDLLVARRICENNPEKHIDVGSRFDGFVAHVACFREIFVLDIRPVLSKVRNIKFMRQDLMTELNEDLFECCDSLSCLHTVEHFGLGRYGDPLNFNGHIQGINNLYHILKPGGKFYFSVPIGLPQRVEFNAHRVFSPAYLVKLLGLGGQKYTLDCFSYVDGHGGLHENVDMDKFLQEYEDNYGCGIFEMTKL
jgi:SAM-dependent methyltransferase